MFDLIKYAKIGDGKYVDIALGKHKIPLTIRELLNHLKFYFNDKKGN